MEGEAKAKATGKKREAPSVSEKKSLESARVR